MNPGPMYEEVGRLRDQPVHLLQERTSDGCRRLVWGNVTPGDHWRQDEYRKTWGSDFDPSTPFGSIGFQDIDGPIKPRVEDLEEHLKTIRIGITPGNRGRNLSLEFFRWTKDWAAQMGYDGHAIYAPELPRVWEQAGYEEFKDPTGRLWLVSAKVEAIRDVVKPEDEIDILGLMVQPDLDEYELLVEIMGGDADDPIEDPFADEELREAEIPGVFGDRESW